MASIAIKTQNDFKIEQGVPCISAAQKFVIPVPAYADGGEPLVFPEGHPKAGEPIVDWQGKPIGDKGLVFFNDKDKVVQAAKSDGQAIVIINQVDASQARTLSAEIERLGGNPAEFSLAMTKVLLARAAEMGLGDQYNSDQAFMSSKLTAVSGAKGFGLFKRDDRDLCAAFIMEEAGSFAGPAAEPQPYKAGDVILAQPDGKGSYTWRKIDARAFDETYTTPSGVLIRSTGRVAG